MRVFCVGDLHCNENFLVDVVYPAAVNVGAAAIVQLGDYGYWEHEQVGVDFLDVNAFLAEETGIPTYWLRGNHDNIDLALTKYGGNKTIDGFVWCRAGVNLIPDGHTWAWAGHTLRAFGGAYSVDKYWRVQEERRQFKQAAAREEFHRRAGRAPEIVKPTEETLWFRHEEMTDVDMDRYLAEYSGPVEIVFSHDKPRSANPGWNRQDLLECWPNQDRMQRALMTHQPSWWLHGHLHHRYADEVRCGDDKTTTVVGLSCDDRAAPRFWKPWDAFCVLDLDTDNSVTLAAGCDLMAQYPLLLDRDSPYPKAA